MFRQLQTLLGEFFFTLIGFNLWTNFIGTIWLDNLLMIFKATSMYHSGAAPFPSSPPRGAFSPKSLTKGLRPLDPFHFRACSAGYLTQKKNSQGQGEGSCLFLSNFFLRAFFPSAFFSTGHFFFGIFFPIPFNVYILILIRTIANVVINCKLP